MSDIKRPDAFNNLIKIAQLKECDRDEEEIRQIIVVAHGALADANNKTLSAHSRYNIAYEAIHGLAVAILLHYGTRPGTEKGHRSVAIEKLSDVLQLEVGLRQVIKHAHDRRNEVTYRSALPPITTKDAESVITALYVVLPKVTKLTGIE